MFPLDIWFKCKSSDVAALFLQMYHLQKKDDGILEQLDVGVGGFYFVIMNKLHRN